MSRLLFLALAAGFDDIASGNTKIADALREEAGEEEDVNGGQMMGGDPAGAPAMAFLADDNVCLAPALFAGNYASNGRIGELTFGIELVIVNDEDIVDIVGDGPDGASIVRMFRQTDGTTRIFFTSDNDNGRRLVDIPGLAANVLHQVHIRSEGTDINGRLYSAHVNGVDYPFAGTTGGGGGGADRPIRIGGSANGNSAGSICKRFYGAKARATDEQLAAVNASTTVAEYTAAVQAIAADAAPFQVQASTNLAVGVENTGTGADAVCIGMTNAENLVAV